MPQLTRKRIAVAATITVALLAVALVVGGRAWVRGQNYLEAGSTSTPPAGARLVPGDFPTIAVVRYRHGGRSAYGFSVRNHGPLAVKITEVAHLEAPGESDQLFRPVEVRMTRRDDFGSVADVPFRPFTLGPGHERHFEVIGRFENCDRHLPGLSHVTRAQQVRFQVLGQSLSEDVPLRTDNEWHYSRAADCPRKAKQPGP